MSTNFIFLTLFLGLSAVEGLRFSNTPISVDTEVLVVGRPSKLTCNYVKYRTESARAISWYLGYSGFRTKIFDYEITTGKKKGSEYPFVKTNGEAATEIDLEITLTDFRDGNMTVGCEVEVIRDNGYGKLRHEKKIAEGFVKAINARDHELVLKPSRDNAVSATPGSETTVTCISKGAEPHPRLTLMMGGRDLREVYTGSIQEMVGNEAKEFGIIGTLTSTPEDYFQNGYLKIECLAHFDNFMFAKKEMSLARGDSRSGGGYSGVEFSGYGTPVYGSNSNGGGGRRMDNGERMGKMPSDFDSESFAAKLMDMVDPARHVHPGVPYDFFAGYIVMVADIKTVASDGYDEVTVIGELPYDVESAMHRNYGRVTQVTPEKLEVKMDPVKVLNILGGHGYRVIGSASGPSATQITWTLEKKNFMKHNDQQHSSSEKLSRGGGSRSGGNRNRY